MITFNSHFWGEKHNGFDVLYHNMKAGLMCSRELEDYIKESCVVEETYMKLQNKLAKMATNYGNRGSFGPFWQLLKSLAEHLSNSHQGILASWQELMRDVHKYTIELQKRHREIKEKEVTTVDTVQSLQQTSVALQKSKEIYQARSVELERLKRDGASQRDMEKVEGKHKKAMEDYKSCIEKYNNLRTEFISNMSTSCQRFQRMEEKHVGEMRNFIDRYYQARDVHSQAISKAQTEFKQKFDSYTIDKIIGMFVDAKGTGSTPPATMEFQEADVTVTTGVSSSVSMLDVSSSGEHNRRNQIGGILSIPIKYRNQKKKNKDNQKVDVPCKSPHLVDEFGFSIKPEEAPPNKRSSFDSSSDDSDNEATYNGGRLSKLRVEIKPIQETVAGRSSRAGNDADDKEIKDIVQGIKLNEVPSKPSNNRKTPVSELSKLQIKPSDDLINLDLFSLPLAASSKPPTTIPPPVPALTASQPTSSLDLPFAQNQVIKAVDIHSEKTESISNRPPAPLPDLPIPPPPSIPPPKPNKTTNQPQLTSIAMPRPAGRNTPDTFKFLSNHRSESVLSLNSVFPSSPQISLTSPPSTITNSPPSHLPSRGPSPFTLSKPDTIPVAVAISETVNAFFHGSSFNKCQAKTTGNVVVSFPGGIVKGMQHLPPLSFALLHTSRVEHLLLNKQLLSEVEPCDNQRIFSFNMNALLFYLRKQSQTNKSAPYFNVEVIKYQLIGTTPSVEAAPLRLACYWKKTPTQADFRLDYTYIPPITSDSNITNNVSTHQTDFKDTMSLKSMSNTNSIESEVNSIYSNTSQQTQNLISQTPNANKFFHPLSKLQVSIQLDCQTDEVSMESLPLAAWSAEAKRAIWKLPDITDDNKSQSVKAKFAVASAASLVSNMCAVQFVVDGTTVSGMQVALKTPAYRLSLFKKRLFTGKYYCEAEIIRNTPH